MIPTISQNTSFLVVSVGHEVRVRDSQKPGEVEAPRATKEKAAERKDLNSESSPKQVDEALIRLQKTLHHVEPRLELSVDKELNQVIVRVIDKESGELIRQIPSEDVLKLERFFADQSGLFVEDEI